MVASKATGHLEDWSIQGNYHSNIYENQMILPLGILWKKKWVGDIKKKYSTTQLVLYNTNKFNIYYRSICVNIYLYVYLISFIHIILVLFY